MGKLGLLLAIIFVIPAYFIYDVFRDVEKPTLKEEFWGAKSKAGAKIDISIRPFEIKVEEKILKDLQSRLKLELSPETSRLTEPLEGIGFQYGFNTKFLRTVGDHWLEKYDWRTREQMLNSYPHFKTTISGLDIHFQHVKSRNNDKYKKTRPLLLLHGWPGSFVEFQQIIPLLTDPKKSDMNFELVIPSLPGYGFSEASHRPGMGTVEMGEIFHKLMLRLGFSKYYIQGGDWGSLIATKMAIFNEENVAGIHINLCSSEHPRNLLRRFISWFSPLHFMDPKEASEEFPLAESFGLFLRETGYAHIQATKPDTVGVGLANSPTGLAAYILEKFATWTNVYGIIKETGDLHPYYGFDELLDNVMIYWVTNSITTSVRLYSEELVQMQRYKLNSVPVKVPTYCLAPRNEFFDMPEFYIKDKYQNLVGYTKANNGGHFTAFEVPKILAWDIVKAFIEFEDAGLSSF